LRSGRNNDLRTVLEALAKDFYFSSEETDDYRKIRKYSIWINTTSELVPQQLLGTKDRETSPEFPRLTFHVTFKKFCQ